jgi:uncharacterized protein YbjT (DUF2867 family)
MTARSALLLGASGLVGSELLRLLAADPFYEKVRAIVRRPLESTPDGATVGVVDFDRPETYAEQLAVDDVFCCLGTTIKKAGSREAFRRVDFEIPLSVARDSRAAGATQYLVVTAVGADATSRVFYSSVKGDVEAALREIDFPRGLKIFRPSLLLGDRAESRPGERAASVVMRATRGLFAGPLARYRAIEAADVARAMLRAAKSESRGVEVYEGEGLFGLVAASGVGKPRTMGAVEK